jgi:type II restriction/modification system DNA methylase subunit YeeA
MTPHEFTAKWRNVELKERTASQSHFNDLCALLGVVDPIAADPAGEWFTFEKGATKTGGGEGWADVWRRGCFAWEYKGPRKDLTAAFSQLLQYSVALENPPLLIVSDMDRIRLHTNWTNTVQEVHEWTLEDLLDGGVRARLKQAFTDPEAFKPAKTRQALTEETAREFAGLAQRLRERGHEAQGVAHFINRLVFCMFAEDVGLLPDHLFTRMLERSRARPASFVANAEMLFGAMATGGDVGFETVDWFNGGLFEDDHVLPLTADDIGDLLKAAGRDWSAIDPAILGTLFERGLDPAKRSQLGAHYTDRAKIDLIVGPVIVQPLEAEWVEARGRIAAIIDAAPRRTADRLLTPAERGRRERMIAESRAVHSGFVERLAAFRVLDPACGSGNFLYVALKALKDIEHRANLDAEALGLPRGFPRVGPENVLGIELNPYAAELARVSVWIGEIQWMRRNGFDAARNPILRPLDTIECRDAVLAEDGTRAEWPEADVVVGNPPFLGDKKMIGELGEQYVFALREAWPQVPGGADLVCYWFAAAWTAMTAHRLIRAGLVATNSIRGGANRAVLKPISNAHSIIEAWSDESWTVEGAAVRVSIVCFANEPAIIQRLNGYAVAVVHSDLTANRQAFDLSAARPLGSNVSVAYIGDQKNGSFDITGEAARKLLALRGNPNGRSNSEVLTPWLNGMDVTRRPAGNWIIDFGTAMPIEDAMLYEAPFAIVEQRVKPMREEVRRSNHRERWWIHGEARPGMRKALAKASSYIATPRVAKHRVFVRLPATILPDCQLVVIARDDDTSFGILHSRFHELWSLRMGTSLEDRPRYTPSTTFETFPFPEGLTPDIPAADYADDPRARAIAAAAARLNELRENWLNPADLVVREPEVVPGYPDRILPRDAAAAVELKKRTLTNLYNAQPVWLANAHAALDAAVADAYGWGEAWRAGAAPGAGPGMTDDDILSRLFALNQARAAAAAGAAAAA